MRASCSLAVPARIGPIPASTRRRVCYLVADALDADPFGVLLLRGRGREEVLAGLRSRRYADTPASGSSPSLAIEPESDEGVPAREAWSRIPKSLPSAPLPPRRAGRSSVLASDPLPDTGVELGALRALASDAAARALALLQGGVSSGLELTVEQDLARRAAALLADGQGGTDPPALTELARRARVPGRELLRRALAFRDGGVEGLAVLEETWDPGPVLISAGYALLGPGATVRRNRVTLSERQLRLGRDGRWYRFRKDRTGRWNPDGAPITPMTDDEVGNLADEEDDR